MSVGTVFCCSICNGVLTAAVRPLEDPSQESHENEKPRLPQGTYFIGEEAPEPGWYVVNLEDALHTKPHPDWKRLQGCCGVDGGNGKTTLCENGHEVGTEKSDCWQAHCLLFDPASVNLKEWK